MAGILSKDIKLSSKAGSASQYEELPLLMEVPEMGGTPEKVDVTTLADASRKYIDGVKDYGDLAFKFLYENTEGSAFRTLRGYEESGTAADYKVELPDGTGFAFSGQVSTKIDSAAVNAAAVGRIPVGVTSFLYEKRLSFKV